MPDIPIMRPQIWQGVQSQGLQSMLGGDKGYTLGANTNYVDSFINIDANQAITPAITVAAGPTSAGASPTAFGYLQDPPINGLVALNPPYIMRADTDNSAAALRMRMFPLSIRGMRFAMNITGTTFQIGTANAAPTLADANCIVGKQLPLIVGGTATPIPAGQYAGVFAVNVGATANPMVRIVEIPNRFRSSVQNATTPALRATMFNGIVIVEFLDTVIQSL